MQRKKSYQAQKLLAKNFEKHHCSFSFYCSNTPQDNYTLSSIMLQREPGLGWSWEFLVVNFLKNRK